MNSEPDQHLSPGESTSGSISESASTSRAWELLGHATPAPIPHGFAARVAAAAVRTPQEGRPSRWMAAVRLGLPLAAAAALLLSVASNLLLPGPAIQGGIAAAPAAAETSDLSNLARIEAALLLLPDDPEGLSLDDAAIELASVDDPTTLTDEQLFGLLY